MKFLKVILFILFLPISLIYLGIKLIVKGSKEKSTKNILGGVALIGFIIVGLVAVHMDPGDSNIKVKEQPKYNILGEKTNGPNQEFIFLAIEEPEKINAREIAEFFNSKYKKEYKKPFDTMTIYVYEKGYKLEDTVEMYRNSKYNITVYHEDNGQESYDMWDAKISKELEKGVLKK